MLVCKIREGARGGAAARARLHAAVEQHRAKVELSLNVWAQSQMREIVLTCSTKYLPVSCILQTELQNLT